MMEVTFWWKETCNKKLYIALNDDNSHRKNTTGKDKNNKEKTGHSIISSL